MCECDDYLLAVSKRWFFNMQMLLQIENVYGQFSKKARNW